jgi:hypothetical protein
MSRTTSLAILAAAAVLSLSPAVVDAQPHHGHAHGGVAVRGYYGYPYYAAPYYWGWGYPWYPIGLGYYYPYPYDYAPDTSSIKLEVTPKQTEVYIDGYRAGTVDEFDGFFQRMRLGSGEHEIVLYLEGYKSVRQVLKLAPGADFKIRHTMVPLDPGQPNDPRPEAPPIPPPAPEQPSARRYPPPQQQGRPVPPPPEALPPAIDTPVEATGFGAIAIRVQPAGAEVWIDGERWEGPEQDGRLVVQVGPGMHRVSIRKPGFVAYETDVEVTVRHTATVNVSLPPQR